MPEVNDSSPLQGSSSNSFESRLSDASGIRRDKGDTERRKQKPIALLLKFLKPITWIPVIWSFVCGSVASGLFTWVNLADWKFWLGVLLTGPLVTGTCQMLNDFFDRHIDQINEPTRPLPAGDISLTNAVLLIAVWSLLSIFAAWLIHPFVVTHSILGIINAHLYSAEPIKLKKRLWWGNIIVAFSYLVFPWLAGEVAYRGEITLPSILISLFYAIASTGTMTVNDFKSTEGDIRVGIMTLPVVFGEKKAAVIASILINVGQVMAALYLLFLGFPIHAMLVFFMILPQIFLQIKFVENPKERDVWYNAIAQNFLVGGMFISALAIASQH
ncbi:MAG: chlorophyll synthase ChlG [Chloroherpetonaceae bacterium]|nr:chlorophyll synthase ChlG [Chloroherpetonaceae bacterium]